MICNNCGSEMPEGSSYCNKCGKKIEAEVESKEIIENTTEEVISVENVDNAENTENTINQNDKIVSDDDDKKANYLTIISLFLLLIVPLLRNAISGLFEDYRISLSANFIRSISILAGFTLLVYTRVTYPRNYASKMVFRILLILLVFCVLIIVQFIITCTSSLNRCSG